MKSERESVCFRSFFFCFFLLLIWQLFDELRSVLGSGGLVGERRGSEMVVDDYVGRNVCSGSQKDREKQPGDGLPI